MKISFIKVNTMFGVLVGITINGATKYVKPHDLISTLMEVRDNAIRNTEDYIQELHKSEYWVLNIEVMGHAKDKTREFIAPIEEVFDRLGIGYQSY